MLIRDTIAEYRCEVELGEARDGLSDLQVPGLDGPGSSNLSTFTSSVNELTAYA